MGFIMSVRAKFNCTGVTYFHDPEKFPEAARHFKFTPQYDMSIPEDRRFQKASPWGEFTIMVDNPAVFDQFKLGQAYYLDLSPVPAT
jgi:hypothetical protein